MDRDPGTRRVGKEVAQRKWCSCSVWLLRKQRGGEKEARKGEGLGSLSQDMEKMESSENQALNSSLMFTLTHAYTLVILSLPLAQLSQGVARGDNSLSYSC